MIPAPAPMLTDRFAFDLERIAGPLAPEARIGIAVSGGPDSLALLLLAHAARPGRIAAATVDHRLRPESAREAGFVAEVCARLGVAHAILPVEAPIGHNIQAGARAARYALLVGWCARERIARLATAHQMDDQAETLLMRLARGSGVGGLAGMRPARPLASDVTLLRPLLGWRRAELAAVVAGAGLSAVDDPANRDERYDRARVRARLAAADWLDPPRLARTAAALAEAEAALAWSCARLAADRIMAERGAVSLDPGGLPDELVRRLLLSALARIDSGIAPRGEAVSRALALLRAGRRAMLGAVLIDPGQRWRLTAAPPRRDSA